jgi:polysaccharide biosynthesis protein PslJ
VQAQAATNVGSIRARGLPPWPLYALFGLFPLWWVLGLGALIWPIIAVPAALTLILRGHVRVPRGFGIWLAFLAWMLGSALMLDQPTRVISFSFRAALYLSATVLFVYVYNASRQDLPVRRAAIAMTLMWVLVVVGGYLGLKFPTVSLHTPTEALMPKGLLANDFVHDLVRPKFAQVDKLSRYTPRPQAPFTYTNEWGSNYALLLPFLFITLAALRTGPLRIGLLMLLPVSLVPAFLSLNRGLWLSLGIGLIYVAFRSATHGRVRTMLAVVLLIGLAVGVAAVLPVRELIGGTKAKTESTTSRLNLYEETIRETLESPVLGYGAPRQSSLAGQPDVGTQGQLWMVLYSHGIPGAAFFVLWLLSAAWRLRRARAGPILWSHVILLMAVVQMPFYGMLPVELQLVMVAAGLGFRELDLQKAASGAPVPTTMRAPTAPSVAQ